MIKKIFFGLFVLISCSAVAQVQTHVIGDSIRIHSNTGTAELILENNTKNINGFLFNKANGRTEFRKGLIKLNDSLYVIGSDTLNIAKSINGNYIRNQNIAAQSANAWISGNAAIGTSAFTTAKLELATAANTEAFKSTISDGSVLSHKGAQGNFSLTPVGTNTVGSIYADGNLSTLGVRSLAGSLVGRMYQSSGSFFIEAPNSGLSVTSTNMTQTSGSINLFRLGSGGFQPTSGNAIFNALQIQPILNQTGTANGNIYGIFYNPTLTSILGTHYGLYINSGINYLAGRTTIGTSSFLTDETLNVNGTAQVRKTFNSSTPVPAFGSGSSIGITGYITVNPGTHGVNNISGVFGGIAVQPGTGNNLLTNNSAGLTGQLTLGDGALTSGGVVPKYSSIYASISGQSSATVNHDNIAFISTSGGLSSGQTITNLYHLYLGSVTGSGGTSGVTNYWGIYQAGGFKNYFGGEVLIGTSTDAGDHKLQVAGNAYINGKQSIGTTSNTALLHLAAGTATASTAPLKFTSGTNLTTPENGTVEYDGTNYFVTSNATRYALARTLTTTSVLNFNNTAPGSSTDLTISLNGAANGDPVSLGVPNESVSGNGSFSAWVSGANTITVRFSNNDLSNSIDPASGTFRITIIKY